MPPIKLTWRDYLIVSAFLAPMLAIYAFRDPIAVALNTNAKMVVGLGALVGAAIAVAMMKARKRAPGDGAAAGPWHRLVMAIILAAGVAYFIMREEIATALNLRIRFLDVLATVAGAGTVALVLRRYLNSNHDDEDAPRPRDN